MFFSFVPMNNGGVDKNNQTYLLELERTYDEKLFRKYIQDHQSDCFIYSVVYLVFIFGGKYFMKNRDRFDLRPFLATWSGLLAIFSIMGAFRTIPELVLALSDGFNHSYCTPLSLDSGTVVAFWSALFTLSKVVELGDTAFIVLRKQPLIFLHWYHHITVLCYVWISYPLHIGSARWFMVMNYFVHSFMYSYYAFRALKFRFPKWVNMFITSLQLSQMVVGVIVTICAYLTLEAGGECSTPRENLRYGFLMYSSYLILFAKFFYYAYIAKKPAHEKSE